MKRMSGELQVGHWDDFVSCMEYELFQPCILLAGKSYLSDAAQNPSLVSACRF